MISIFKWDGKWRLRIENETLEFKNLKEGQDIVGKLMKLKEDYEPHKNEGDTRG